ncbi:auxin-responsive protein IAA18-like [Cynara cardunculus var. scolymus]|uniref:auxin-responsive protein IAA18-like n=1 Tax=Cynara cardunculus var. scolymus TaxID=59895 RepID=UPI000D62F83F|nr:auxin-responsive protein IAA18-like [Cynara cardunculus var. scolymus]
MEGYPKLKKVMIKEGCEETRLELRLCPPGDDLYSIGGSGTHGTNCPPKKPMFKTSQKRVAAVVVGWPPVRTSRKNIMTSSYNSTKVVSLPEKAPAADSGGGKKTSSDHENSLYVKINMDGVAIGRKVDLKAYDNYQRLSSSVDELFKGLLAAQGDVSSSTTKTQIDVTTGLLDGNGGYTLVYEDNEGDRILVGDVPWNMFISSAKRLRVLKTSELSVCRHWNN